MKKIITYLFSLFFVFICLIFFYNINGKNYQIIKQNQLEIVNEPFFAMKKEYAKKVTFGFSNLRSDFYWLQTIQYIGSSVISLEYKKYLYEMLDLITELTPHFENAYNIGQLLLPSYNMNSENLTDKIQQDYINKGEKIGEKGIKNLCESEKIKKIENIKDETKIKDYFDKKEYKNPCKSYLIPYSQGFIEFFYKKNPELSRKYYKISSFNKDAPSGSRSLYTLMSGKSNKREVSIKLYLGMALEKKNKDDEICMKVEKELNKIRENTFINNVKLNEKVIKILREINNNFLNNGNKDTPILDNCSNYLKKAIREFNLEYINNANIKFKEDTKRNSKNAKELYEKKYIKVLPIDYQQNKNSGIIYFYNKDIGNYDVKIGKY